MSRNLQILLVFAMLACWLVSGCRDPHRARLVGRWELVQSDRIARRLKQNPQRSAEAAPAGMDGGMERNVEGGVESGSPRAGNGAVRDRSWDSVDSENGSTIEIEFRKDGSWTTTTRMGKIAPPPKKGRWELLTFDEEANVMKIQCIYGRQVSEHEIEFLDGETIRLVPPNLAGLRLKLKFKRLR